jgi:Cu/Ag efflux pump CusA
MVTGPDATANEAYAHGRGRMARIGGIADVRLQQASNYPQIGVNIDRAQADRLGITENDVTRSLSVGLSGSSSGGAHLLAQPQERRVLPIVVQAPLWHTDSIAALQNTHQRQHRRCSRRCPLWAR